MYADFHFSSTSLAQLMRSGQEGHLGGATEFR